jgi:hypothetical protein
MEADTASLIAGDVTAHRHHLMPFLDLLETQIAATAVAGGKEEVDVDFTVSAAEEELDDTTEQLIGDDTVRRWTERWHFERDPSIDSSTIDREHWGEWLVAHRGWLVTAMTRLGDPVPQPAPA